MTDEGQGKTTDTAEEQSLAPSSSPPPGLPDLSKLDEALTPVDLPGLDPGDDSDSISDELPTPTPQPTESRFDADDEVVPLFQPQLPRFEEEDPNDFDDQVFDAQKEVENTAGPKSARGQRILLKIPDDEVPISVKPPPVEEAKPDVLVGSAAVIQAMRIISIGEAQPPESEKPPPDAVEQLGWEDHMVQEDQVEVDVFEARGQLEDEDHLETDSQFEDDEPLDTDHEFEARDVDDIDEDSEILGSDDVQPLDDIEERLGRISKRYSKDEERIDKEDFDTEQLMSEEIEPVDGLWESGIAPVEEKPVDEEEELEPESYDELHIASLQAGLQESLETSSGSSLASVLSPTASAPPPPSKVSGLEATGPQPLMEMAKDVAVGAGPMVEEQDSSTKQLREYPEPVHLPVIQKPPSDERKPQSVSVQSIEGVAESPVGLAAPPKAPPPPKQKKQLAEGEKRTRKGRAGWELVFADDFVRAYPRLSRKQVASEVSFIEKSLSIQQGGVVLDLGCGSGQHAVELASRGYNVVGYDLSLTMLAMAADEAQERGQKINFLQGDMREMAFEEMFDGIFSWSTSFGFFDEETNATIIQRIHRALRKGGMFLLDLVNRDHICARLPTLAWFEGDGCVCIDDAQFDSITSRIRVKRTIMIEDGTSREADYSIRLYSLHEIGRILHESGFKVIEVSGHPASGGAFFDAESPRVITLAVRR